MDQTWGQHSALAAAGTADASDARPAPVSPSANGAAPSGWRRATPTEEARPSGHDLDRLAGKMNDVVVHRIFAAGLDLQAALSLLGGPGTEGEDPAASEHPAARKIWHATDELDHAISDLRAILFEPW